MAVEIRDSGPEFIDLLIKCGLVTSRRAVSTVPATVLLSARRYGIEPRMTIVSSDALHRARYVSRQTSRYPLRQVAIFFTVL